MRVVTFTAILVFISSALVSCGGYKICKDSTVKKRLYEILWEYWITKRWAYSYCAEDKKLKKGTRAFKKCVWNYLDLVWLKIERTGFESGFYDSKGREHYICKARLWAQYGNHRRWFNVEFEVVTVNGTNPKIVSVKQPQTTNFFTVVKPARRSECLKARPGTKEFSAEATPESACWK